MYELFRRLAHRTAAAVGRPWAFLLAVLVVLVWGATGAYYHYSNTWQLVINTGTTIITFLMVFLIQNTQNRDAMVVHLKLDELIRAVKEARTELVDMESLSDEELTRLQQQFERLRVSAERKRAARGTRHDAPRAGG
jgi:low affinity Fe/Cu permease